MKKLFYVIIFTVFASFCGASLNGCTGGQGGDPWRYDPGIPDQVTGLQAVAGTNAVTLSWTGNPIAVYYNIYYISELNGTKVTKSNGIKISSDKASFVVTGLDNNITYYFVVTAVNKDGESVESAQVSAKPRSFSNHDLVYTEVTQSDGQQADVQSSWYFHTMATGPDAKWERGTMTVTMDGAGNCTAQISDFQDSAHFNPADPTATITPPPAFGINLSSDGVLTQSGANAWPYFHGIMGSRKNMMVATWSPTMQSRSITVFQRKDPKDNDYSIEDISGTGSGQNPYHPYLQGNGPTRFTYHQLYSGTNTQWEYCNAKVGQHGYIWIEQYKDVIYWDFSTPEWKGMSYDLLWKVTSFGIDSNGLVNEYWNYTNVVSPQVPSYDYLVPKSPHEVVFTGRMTSDKTVVVGVGTRTDYNNQNPQYFLRIMELCFIPTDQTLPAPDLNDLAGTYRFHELSSTTPGSATPNVPSWAYGNISITASGATDFPAYTDSFGNNQLTDTFALAYYPDPNPDAKIYRDFANFTTPAQSGSSHYYDASGNPLHKYYDFFSYPSVITDPSTWRLQDISPKYFNEHGTLSYLGDLLVMTRTDSSGYSMLIGLK